MYEQTAGVRFQRQTGLNSPSRDYIVVRGADRERQLNWSRLRLNDVLKPRARVPLVPPPPTVEDMEILTGYVASSRKRL